MLRLYIWGYLNQIRSSRHLERGCKRDLKHVARLSDHCRFPP
ncbi:hypothetical protein [Mesorhizobium sp. M0615]